MVDYRNRALSEINRLHVGIYLNPIDSDVHCADKPNDGVINLVETKFYEGPYRPDKRSLKRLEQQQRVFQAASKTRKQLSWVLLVAEGGERTVGSQGVIDHFLSGEELFRRL